MRAEDGSADVHRSRWDFDNDGRWDTDWIDGVEAEEGFSLGKLRTGGLEGPMIWNLLMAQIVVENAHLKDNKFVFDLLFENYYQIHLAALQNSRGKPTFFYLEIL